MTEYIDVMHKKNVMSVLSQEISKLQQTVVDVLRPINYVWDFAVKY